MPSVGSGPIPTTDAALAPVMRTGKDCWPGASANVEASDWVGAEGRLADAGMASAKRAAQEVLARLQPRLKLLSLTQLSDEAILYCPSFMRLHPLAPAAVFSSLAK